MSRPGEWQEILFLLEGDKVETVPIEVFVPGVASKPAPLEFEFETGPIWAHRINVGWYR